MSEQLAHYGPAPLTIALPGVLSEVTIAGEVLATRDRLLAKARAVGAVSNQAEFEAATEAQAAATKFLGTVEKQRLAFTRPLDAAKKTVIKAVDAAFGELEAEKARVQALASQYADDQRRAAEAERQRLEREQQDAIARQVQEQEAQQAALAEAFGEDIQPAPEPVIAPAMPAPAVETPRSYAASIRERVVFAVADPDAVPRAFLTVDERKVREWARENEDRIRAGLADAPPAQLVPGIVFSIETKTVGR